MLNSKYTSFKIKEPVTPAHLPRRLFRSAISGLSPTSIDNPNATVNNYLNNSYATKNNRSNCPLPKKDKFPRSNSKNVRISSVIIRKNDNKSSSERKCTSSESTKVIDLMHRYKLVNDELTKYGLKNCPITFKSNDWNENKHKCLPLTTNLFSKKYDLNNVNDVAFFKDGFTYIKKDNGNPFLITEEPIKNTSINQSLYYSFSQIINVKNKINTLPKELQKTRLEKVLNYNLDNSEFIVCPKMPFCNYYHCKYYHPLDICKLKDQCNRETCLFFHPERIHIEQCKYNLKCKNLLCNYMHDTPSKECPLVEIEGERMIDPQFNFQDSFMICSKGDRCVVFDETHETACMIQSETIKDSNALLAPATPPPFLVKRCGRRHLRYLKRFGICSFGSMCKSGRCPYYHPKSKLTHKIIVKLE